MTNLDIIREAREFARGFLLWLLNSHLVNGRTRPYGERTYGRYNGLEGWSYESLQSEEHQQPGITVCELLKISDQFKECMKRGGNCVIEGDEIREMNDQDIEDIQKSLDPWHGIFRP